MEWRVEQEEGVKRNRGASKERDEGKWEKQEGEKNAGGKRW